MASDREIAQQRKVRERTSEKLRESAMTGPRRSSGAAIPSPAAKPADRPGLSGYGFTDEDRAALDAASGQHRQMFRDLAEEGGY